MVWAYTRKHFMEDLIHVHLQWSTKVLASTCCVCSYHVYHEIWELAAAVGEILVHNIFIL